MMRMSSVYFAVAGVLAALALSAGTLAADDLTVGTAPYTGVKIQSIDDGRITFVVPRTGAKVTKLIVEVSRIVCDDAALTAAEETLAAGKLDEAAKQYQAAAKNAAGDWRGPLIRYRLTQIQDTQAAAAAAALAAKTAAAALTGTGAAVPAPPAGAGGGILLNAGGRIGQMRPSRAAGAAVRGGLETGET